MNVHRESLSSVDHVKDRAWKIFGLRLSIIVTLAATRSPANLEGRPNTTRHRQPHIQRLTAYRRPGFPVRKRYVVRRIPANNHVRSDFRKELLVHSGQAAGQAASGPRQRPETIRQPESCTLPVYLVECDVACSDISRSSFCLVKPTRSHAVNDPLQARRQSSPP